VELPFVESNKIKQLMENFCSEHFKNRPEQTQCLKSTEGIVQTAKDMSEQACAEIRAAWTHNFWQRWFARSQPSTCERD
jgi:hypothetical protein